MNLRVLACDLDGVIFDFNASFIALLNTFYGARMPASSEAYPDTWHYPLDGKHVTREQYREAWQLLASSYGDGFWRHLPVYRWSREFLRQAGSRFDVVFVTARPRSAYDATVASLEALGVTRPRVIIADHKFDTLVEIGATHFLDDRDQNFDECASLPIQHYLLDQPWNRAYRHPRVKRIKMPFALLAFDLARWSLA